jgi:hypothetical protein
VLFDMRTYTCRPGALQAQLDLYERHGLEVQTRHLGEPFFYAVTETGPLNSFVHIWAYQDAADRQRRRQAMEADPEWATYRKKVAEAGYLVAQETRLMKEVSFFKPPQRG